MLEQITTDMLIQMGVLGLWTATLIVEKVAFQKKLETVIQNNTTALIKVYEYLKDR